MTFGQVDTRRTGHIYMISHNSEPELIYIGSTFSINTRAWQHEYNTARPMRRGAQVKLYAAIRQHGGWDAFTMSAVEEYPCHTKEELRVREQFHFEEMQATLNSIRPFLSHEQLLADKRAYNASEKGQAAVRAYRERPYVRQKEADRSAARSAVRFHCELCDVDVAMRDKSRHCRSACHLKLEAGAGVDRVRCEACNCSVGKASWGSHITTEKHVRNSAAL